MLKILFDSGINGKIIDDNNEVMLVNGKVEILKTHYKYLSVIPLSDNTEVNISGVKYPLKNKRVSFNDSLCISNEINEKTATVEVSSYSLVIQSNDYIYNHIYHKKFAIILNDNNNKVIQTLNFIKSELF